MRKKLSQKERKEPVDKGFLVDYVDEVLESKNYVTKDYLESCLESKNYVTKDWATDMFETFEKRIDKRIEESFGHHMRAIMEENRHYFNSIIEILLGRVERNEDRIDTVEKRLTYLETKPGF
jgi:hypothetical protein